MYQHKLSVYNVNTLRTLVISVFTYIHYQLSNIGRFIGDLKMTNILICLFMISVSMIVGISAAIEGGQGAGLIIFGCAAMFIGGIVLLCERLMK